MKRLALFTLTMTLAGVSPLFAQSPPPQPASPPPAAPPQTPPSTQPVYKPPLRGAPGGRIGGGTRGIAGETLSLSVLAPDDRALTVSEQPILYWFISGRTSHPVEIVVMDPSGVHPALDLNVPPPTAAGLHSIRLADHGIRLEPGIAYRWYVAVVADPARRSRDILAGGTVERVEPAPDLSSTLARVGPAERASLYANAGLWYDALATLSQMIEQSPGDPSPQQQRAALLKQVGLPDVGGP